MRQANEPELPRFRPIAADAPRLHHPRIDFLSVSVHFLSIGWKWPLRAGDEVVLYNKRNEVVAVLPGALLLALIGLYLDSHDGHPLNLGRLDPPRRPLAVAPSRGFSAEQRTRFRQRRRARKR